MVIKILEFIERRMKIMKLKINEKVNFLKVIFKKNKKQSQSMKVTIEDKKDTDIKMIPIIEREYQMPIITDEKLNLSRDIQNYT